MSELALLASTVGLQPTWVDYRGTRHVVNEDGLRHILAALGYEARSRTDISASLHYARTLNAAPNRLIIGGAGQQVRVPAAPGPALFRLETGAPREIELVAVEPYFSMVTLPSEYGYHILEHGSGTIQVAVAPPRAMQIADIAPDEKLWGMAAQLYSLNNGGGVGDFADAGRLCADLALHGADALAISPTHALFAADPSFYAPYSPSSRLFLNPIYASGAHAATEDVGALIDWCGVTAAKRAAMQAEYAAFVADGAARAEFESFVLAGGEALLAHARFEALDARFRAEGVTDWRDWPGDFSDACSAEVQALSAMCRDVEIHLYAQWRADRSMGEAHAAACRAGMRVGLITDVAVGMLARGSQAWSEPAAILQGVSIGAPPDLLSRSGQSWGLTSFSPVHLRRSGFGSFLATLRAAMRHAGGVRIDHALGLQRLWIIPDGADPSGGAYLRYPIDDMLKLIALESWRHRVVVVGEDLGTVPADFRARCSASGVAGMRVLWFERAADGGFIPPFRWEKQAVGMTTTHDLPTVAGWWRGRDITWRARISGEKDHTMISERKRDAVALWQAMSDSGSAAGEIPDKAQADRVVDAAISHVAGAACDLVLVGMEDVLGLEEQPNLPGTIDEHPNWRRRLPPGNGIGRSIVRGRLERLNEIRRALVQ
jgi:4-alpha-glucanotransferase